MRWQRSSGNVDSAQTAPNPNTTFPSLGGFIIAGLFVLFGLGALYFIVLKFGNPTAEIQLSLVIAAAVVGLMMVLFIIAGGFARMGLGTPLHALGLPEGSVRALIALILIQIFIVFGLFLYSQTDEYYGPFEMTKEQLEAVEDPVMSRLRQDGRYDVWLNRLGEDQSRLAQQLLTTVGTLVVAVAGFYFGSTAVTNAVSASTTATADSLPTISGFTPKTGKAGATISSLTIYGSNYRAPMRVRLVRDGEQLVATNVQVVSPAEVRCDVALPTGASGAWFVVVENADGWHVQSRDGFDITA